MPDTRIQGFQLSPQQRDLWTRHHGRDDASYRARCSVRISGPLQRERLAHAVEAVARRHEILRTSFYASAEMSTPIQVVTDHGPLLEVHDLSALDAASCADALERLDDATAPGPTDYAHAPLVRCRLAVLSSMEHVLTIDAPALCSDGDGLVILAEALSRTYGGDQPAPATGQDDVLQYVDAAIWLNDTLTAPETAAGRHYWESQDVGAALERSLPFEIAGSEHSAFTPRRIPVALPQPLGASVMLADNRIDSGLFLLACWQSVLQRMTGEPRLLVGVQTNGRHHAELDKALGLFARCLPLTGALPDDLRFIDVVARLQDATAQARGWADAFDWSVIRRPETKPRRPPFVAFVAEHRTRPRRFAAGAVTFVVEDVRDHVTPFKLRLVSSLDADGHVRAALEYDASLYRIDDVARLAGHLETAIEDAWRRPHACVGELRLVSDRQREDLFASLHAPAAAAPAACVHQLFERQVEATPDAAAVVCADATLTYAELNARANRLAHHLRAQGVGPDVAVGLCVERSSDVPIGILAILKAGGAYVPLDPRLPGTRLRGMVEDAGARVVVTRRHLGEEVARSASPVWLDADADLIAGQPASNPAGATEPGHAVYVMFTSGSTGRPKGVTIEHRQLANYVRGVLERLAVPAGAAFATVTTFAADLGNTAIYPALLSGGCLHVVTEEQASDPEAFAEYCQAHRVDVLKIVPSHLKALLSAARPERILPRLRLVLGGEACPWDLVDQVRQLAPACIVLNHYGPTETTVGATTYEVSSSRPFGSGASVPIGRPLPHVTAHVLDHHGQHVPMWMAGELYIGGAGVARGYLEQPGAPERRFVPDPFSHEPGARLYRTGDLVRVLPAGVVEFIGRADDQVKVRGFRVEPGEIAAALRRHPAVGDAVVAAQDATAAGEKRLVGFVTGRNGGRPDPAELAQFLRRDLPDYMVPAQFVVLQALPLTPNGKIDRQALPALVETVRPASAADDGPSSPWELIIAEVWRDLLHADHVSTDDNFYDLGGHSLLAIQVVTAIEKRTGLHLSPRDLVFHTLRQFAALCESRLTIDPGAPTTAL